MLRFQTVRVVLMLLFIAVSNACSFSLPEPPLVEQPSSAFAEVPYPPPAALAETVPERPKQCDCVWVEGSWRFRSKSYAWQRGGWFRRPANARYARAKAYFAADGRVMYAPALWYDAQGNALDHVRPVVPAVRPKNEFTSESETAR